VKDSFLDRLKDIRYLDLTKLIGGKYIIIFYILAKNGLFFSTKTLIDLEANSFAFIDILYRDLASII
jgi:hypothetical protein